MSKEILLVVESVSHEKGVSKDVLFGAIESALAVATKKRYGEDAEFRVAIDRDSGEYETFRTWAVVDFDEIEADEEAEVNPEAQYSVEQAQSFKPGAVLGDVIEEQVESVAFGRIAAQTAKQVIVQRVRDAERAQSPVRPRRRRAECDRGGRGARRNGAARRQCRPVVAR